MCCCPCLARLREIRFLRIISTLQFKTLQETGSILIVYALLTAYLVASWIAGLLQSQSLTRVAERLVSLVES